MFILLVGVNENPIWSKWSFIMEMWSRETNLTALFNVFDGSDRIRGISPSLFPVVLGVLILVVWSEHYAFPLQQPLAAARIVRSQNLSCAVRQKPSLSVRNNINWHSRMFHYYSCNDMTVILSVSPSNALIWFQW